MILDGITVVDLTTGLAGSMATRLLAEAGSDVLKVETPDGDPDRADASFASWNRSKRSIVADWTQPDGAQTLEHILSSADVLVHCLLPTEAARLRLDERSMRSRHPDVVVVAITPYPAGHPDENRPGSDLLIQARSGMSDEQGCSRPGPTFISMPAPSWSAAYLTAAGILARLIVRRRTGRSGPVRTSLLQGALSCLTLLWNQAERPTPRMAAKLPMPKRLSANCFQCADGRWIQTSSGYWLVPLVVATLADLGVDGPGDMVDPGPDFAEVYQQAFATRPAEEWLSALWESDVPTQIVADLGDVLTDAQAKANGYTVEVDDPVWGRCIQAGLPFVCDPPLAVRGPAPVLGEHTDAPLPGTAHGGIRETATAPYPAEYPLEGLRVLDLGMFVGSPYGAMLLGDLGADVIKLEPPTGDRMRLDEMLFITAGRGKRSICIDLKKPGGRTILDDLIRWADVVHHNLRPEAAARLGIDHASIAAVNPSAISCHVTAFGPRGDKAGQSCFDPQMQATSGWMLAGAGPGNRPIWLRFAPTDVQCAQLSLVATLLALYQREKTGRGSALDVSMLAGAVMTNSETLVRLDDGSLAPIDSVDRWVTGTRAGYRLYEAANGWIAVAIPRRQQAESLHRMFGTDDPAVIAKQVKGMDKVTALDQLSRAGIPAEAVCQEAEGAFFTDPANQHAGLVAHSEHPIYGHLAQVGRFWDFSDLKTQCGAPPTLGQHTRSVLEEQGYSAHEILELVASGICSGDRIA